MAMPEQLENLPSPITPEMLAALHREDLLFQRKNDGERTSPESREHRRGPALWGGPETGLGWHRRGPNSRDW